MTDRKKCRSCIYSGFTGTQLSYWQGCSYLIYTGQKRPHSGDECFGYQPKAGRRARRKANIVVSESSTAAYITAPKKKPANKPKKQRARYPDPDREIKAAAKKIMRVCGKNE